MPRLDDQISTLQDKLALLKLRQQRLDARQRAIAADRERKTDTRRRLLLGGVMLDKMNESASARAQVLAWLDQALSRPAERALFDLPPVPPTDRARPEAPDHEVA